MTLTPDTARANAARWRQAQGARDEGTEAVPDTWGLLPCACGTDPQPDSGSCAACFEEMTWRVAEALMVGARRLMQ